MNNKTFGEMVLLNDRIDFNDWNCRLSTTLYNICISKRSHFQSIICQNHCEINFRLFSTLKTHVYFDNKWCTMAGLLSCTNPRFLRKYPHLYRALEECNNEDGMCKLGFAIQKYKSIVKEITWIPQVSLFSHSKYIISNTVSKLLSQKNVN